MVGLDDLDQQKVIFEVSELLRRRAVDESGIHRFLLPSLAVEADDADLPSYVLPAQQISARMRRYRVDHAHVLLAGLHQLAVLRGHKVRQYDFLILLGKPDRLFVGLQLIAHLVGDVEGQVCRPAEHLPRRQPFQRAEGHHGRAAPLADDLRLGFLEGLPVGDVHVDVRQAARQDPVRRYEAVREHLHRDGEAVYGRQSQQRIRVVAGSAATPGLRDDATLLRGAAHDLMVEEEIVAHVGGGHHVGLVFHACGANGFLLRGHVGSLGFKRLVDQREILLIALLLGQIGIDRRQLLRFVELYVLKGQEGARVLHCLPNLRVRQHALLPKAPVCLRARGVIHVPAALVFIADAVGLQSLIPQRGVLRVDEVAVRAHDQRDAVLAVQPQQESVDLPLFVGVVILHFQHEAVPEVARHSEDQLFRFLPAVLVYPADAGRCDEHIPGVECHQQFQVHPRAIVVAADIRLGQREVQVTDALAGSGRQYQMAV